MGEVLDPGCAGVKGFPFSSPCSAKLISLYGTSWHKCDLVFFSPPPSLAASQH